MQGTELWPAENYATANPFTQSTSTKIITRKIYWFHKKNEKRKKKNQKKHSTSTLCQAYNARQQNIGATISLMSAFRRSVCFVLWLWPPIPLTDLHLIWVKFRTFPFPNLFTFLSDSSGSKSAPFCLTVKMFVCPSLWYFALPAFRCKDKPQPCLFFLPSCACFFGLLKQSYYAVLHSEQRVLPNDDRIVFEVLFTRNLL